MSGDLPDVDDSTGQYVSIYLPNTQDQSYPQYHYLRIGSPDTTTENSLPDDPNLPQNKNDVLGGINLYTTGSYSLTAPTATTWSAESLAAVVGTDKTLYTATYTTGAANGMRPATVTFQNVDQMTNTAAASVNFLNGDALTYWNGNDQSLGIGGLLWANYGWTTNLFGGQIINLTNDSAEVQGYGAFKVADSSTLSTTDGISFSVSPAAAAWAAATAMTKTYTITAAVLTGITGAMTIAMTAELKTADPSELKTRMQILYIEQIVTLGLVTLIQAMSILLGAALKLTQQVLLPLHSIEINPVTGIMLQSGPTSIAITPAGITMNSGAATFTLFPGQASLEAPAIGLISGASIVSLAPAMVLIDGTTVDIEPG